MATIDPAIKKNQTWLESLAADIRAWVREDWRWYLMSFLFHAALMLLIAIFTALVPHRWRWLEPAVSLNAADTRQQGDWNFEKFDVGQAPLDPTRLDADALRQFQQPAQTAKYYDDSLEFVAAGGGRDTDKDKSQFGGLGGFKVTGVEGVGGLGGIGFGKGDSTHAGIGGNDSGLGARRGKGHRAHLGGGGGTPDTDRAVVGAINWLARHQNANGSWSLQHNRRCAQGSQCSAPARIHSDVAATAMALLPFLGAGQTQKGGGPYMKQVGQGLFWLAKRQRETGDLADGGDFHMYTHALATIVLCEAFGMTHDDKLGGAAQRALRFIETSQNPTTGSWRYEPGDPGDTSVYGWQIMALRSGQLAGLSVNSMTIETARKWLPMVAKGGHKGLFAYQPYREVSETMTAVGILCTQYLGAARDDPAMVEGREYLLANLPDNDSLRSIYYWYYATMAMHNFMGPEWDTWNRKTRRVLIESQCHGGCQEGSWDPVHPTLDTWAEQGGRLMMTSLAALTLEVYYRYLPLFKVETSDTEPPAAAPGVVSKGSAGRFTGN